MLDRRACRLSLARGWAVERISGTAGELHSDRSWGGGPERRVWLCECTRPAVVLGSTQSSDDVDAARALAGGVDVVRRRSGGGAVLVVPGETIWVDVALPSGDPLWETDVGRAFEWLGRSWADALDALGLGPAAVHQGPLLRNEWSSRVCFVGLGPGEVTVAGRKVVGLSQRRSREGAFFSCAAYVGLGLYGLADLLVVDDDNRAPLKFAIEDRAAPLAARAVQRADVEEALLACLPIVTDS
jgi:lipoate-protein ligase A